MNIAGTCIEFEVVFWKVSKVECVCVCVWGGVLLWKKLANLGGDSHLVPPRLLILIISRLAILMC